MRIVFTLSLLILTNFLFSQNIYKDIELPKIDSEFEFSKNYITALLDIYLKEDGTVYIKDSLVDKENLGALSMKFKIANQPMHRFIYLASLNIDKNTPYKYVDFVKNQLDLSVMKYYYRTSNNLDINQGFYYQIHRPTLFEMKIINDSIKTFPREFAGYQETDLLHTFLDNMYCHRYKKAKSILKKLKYTKIEFLKDNYVRINGENIIKTKSKQFEAELKNSDICFSVYNPNLRYKDYLNNLYIVSKLVKKYRGQKMKSAYFFEVSGEINSILINEIKI